MTLEFNRLVEQIYRMGSMLDKLDFDVRETLELAAQRFQEMPNVAQVMERINQVRQSNISGYRGAAPLDTPGIAPEPINRIFPEPPLPQQATIIAVDGSQVYPDELAPVHYYLINIGTYIYYHGSDRVPEQVTRPDLKFHKDHVHDRYGQMISNRTVDDRRTAAEMQYLSHAAWQHLATDSDVSVLALYDNRLLFLPGNDAGDGDLLMRNYHSGMVHLRDANAILAGYIDNPMRAKRVIQLLYLMSLADDDDIRHKQHELSRAGDLEGLRDAVFFNAILRPGERSAIMVQNSPQNKAFRDRGENYEIAFFYLKVYNNHREKIVRVDIPMWVVREGMIDTLHALLLHQCKLQGRNPYPYALTRADELAWVSGKDQAKLRELVNTQIRRVKQDLVGRTLTAKARGKELARSPQRYFDIWGEEIIDDK